MDKRFPLDGSGLKPLRLIDLGDGSFACATASIFDRFVEEKTEADAVEGTVTFTGNFTGGIVIQNTSATAGAFVVNGLTIHVAANSTVRWLIGGTPAKTVAVTGATSYIISQVA